MTCSWNTSLAAHGALAHRLQHCRRPIHINANSCAHSSSPPPGEVGPTFAESTFSFKEPLYMNSTWQHEKEKKQAGAELCQAQQA